METIKIKISCNENHVAESLRQMANAFEQSDGNLSAFETEHCVAEFS